MTEWQRFQVDVFNDPIRAVEEFKTNFYDLLILDIRMPGMTGFELDRALRPKDENVSIIFLTAFDIYYKEFPKMFPDMKRDKCSGSPSASGSWSLT